MTKSLITFLKRESSHQSIQGVFTTCIIDTKDTNIYNKIYFRKIKHVTDMRRNVVQIDLFFIYYKKEMSPLHFYCNKNDHKSGHN